MSWCRSSVPAILKDTGSIDPDIVDSGGKLMRIGIRRPVTDGVGVEDNHVGVHALLEKPSFLET